MTPSFSPTQADKSAALEHVHYEIWQLLQMCIVRPEGAVPPQQARALCNAVLESRLLHLRALLGFFETCKANRCIHDVLAEDYGFSARHVEIDKDTRKGLNKDLAHITYARSQHGPLGIVWPVDRTVVPVLGVAGDFIRHLLDDYPQQNQPESVLRWRDLLAEVKSMLGAEPFPSDIKEAETMSPARSTVWDSAVTATSSVDG